MNDLALLLLAIGLIFMLAAVLTYWFPPKKINALYGYRSRRSMQSAEAWSYAQKLSPKYLLRLALALIFAGVLFWILRPGWPLWVEMVVGLGLLFVGIAIMLIRIEKKLQQKFS